MDIRWRTISVWVREHHGGIPAVWQKHVNVGHAIDVKLLNWLPRDS
ncbi:MAG: hypothetical protein U0905_08065 [Pirellulales bacterium]